MACCEAGVQEGARTLMGVEAVPHKRRVVRAARPSGELSVSALDQKR